MTSFTNISKAAETQPVFIIDSLFELQMIDSKYLHLLPDTNKKITIETIQDKVFLPANQFPPPGKRKNQSIYWTKIIFHNQLEVPQEYWLSVPVANSYGYLVRASGGVVPMQTGFSMPHKEKTIQEIRLRFANYLPIALGRGEKATLYLRNQYGGNSIILTEIKRVETPNHARLATLKTKSAKNLSAGFFQALLLILFLYCLFYAFYAKEIFAIYLALFCFFFSIHFLYADGLLYEYTGIKNFPVLFNILDLTVLNLVVVFECYFIQNYLALKIRLPKIYSFLNAFIYFDIFLLITLPSYFLISKDFALPFNLVVLFQFIWLIIRPFILINIWFLKNTKARIFALAWAIAFLFVLGSWTAYLIPGFDGANLLKLGISIYVSIIVISLSYYAAKTRTDKLIFEKESIQQQLELEQQRNERILIEKEKELLTINAAELKELGRLKSRFFTNISHELRTPLTLLLGPLKMIIESGQLTGENRILANLGKKSAQNLLGLVDEILELTKLEVGKAEIEEVPTKLYLFLKDLISAFDGFAIQKNIQYSFDYKGNKNLQLQIDIKKTGKIVNNLIANAFKYTPRDGQILVKVRQQEKVISISVKDDGRGVSAKDLPKVFNRFFRSSQVNSQVESGTGIGLSLCMELTKLIKGKLWVESTLGIGSTFYFEFPLKEVKPVVISVDRMETEEKITILPDTNFVSINQQIPTTILLVEDNADLRDYIQIIIGKKYKLIKAENGKVAWDLLKNKPNDLPALIISDIMMPEMDGFELLGKLKGNNSLSGIPIIMLTALTGLEDKLHALRIGIDDYLTKPFEQEELLARIDNLLRNSRARKTFFTQQKMVEEKQKISFSYLSLSKNLPLYSSETISKEDLEWLIKLEQTIMKELTNFKFTVLYLAQQMVLSKRSLELKLKRLTGLTPSKYIQEIQYVEARRLLENNKYKSVKAIIYQLGIKDADNFTKLFKQRFGKLPSEYF